MIINIYANKEDSNIAKESSRAPNGGSWHNWCKKKEPDNIGGCCTDLQDLCIRKCEGRIIDDGDFDYIKCERDCDSAWSDCSAVLEDETDPELKEQRKKIRAKRS